MGSAVVAGLCMLLAVILLVGIRYLATEQLIDQLVGADDRVAASVEQGEWHNPIPHSHIRDVQVVDQRGRVIAATTDLQGKPPMGDFSAGRAGHVVEKVCDGIFGPARCDLVAAVSVYRDGVHWTVYSAAPVIPLYVHPWLAALVAGSAGALVVAISFGGYQILGRTLLPVHSMQSELDEIEATDVSRRVTVSPSRDEIHDLAESVNRTLERLQAAMGQLRRFTSDASHELRTPVAAMRAQIEDALLAPEETTVPTLGGALLPSLDRLQAIITDLMMIARLEGGASVARRPLDLAALVTTEVERRQHPSKEIKCDLSPGVLVMGQESALARALTNLVDNAERHASHTVTITVRREAGDAADLRFLHGAAILEVLDDGPGIRPDQRETVFQRFTRLDTARSRNAGGSGLGLSIARQIAEGHQGSLTIEDSPHGARFVLRLPLSTAQEP
ncbi:HAMP domain-containing sensor histidine kinase [Planotetraspora phitsanulokensis]